MKFIYLFISLLLVSNFSNGQIKVYDISQASSAKNEGGIFYTLPKTKARVEFIVKKMYYKKGSLYDHTWLQAHKNILEKYLDYDDDNIITALQNTNSHTLYNLKESDIIIKGIPVADHSKTYLVQTTKKITKGSVVTLKIGDDLQLQSAESTVSNQTFEIITKGISGLAKIAFNFSGGGVLPGFATLDNAAKSRIESTNNPTTVDLRTFLLGKLIELEVKAYNLYNGSTDVQSSELLKQMLEKIQEAQNEILGKLAYSQTTTVMNYVFEINPSASDQGTDFHLFDFTPVAGVRVGANTNEIGKRIYLITSAGNGSGAGHYHVTATQLINGSVAPLLNIPATNVSNEYYRVNIPAKAYLKVLNNTSAVTYVETPMPQWGSIGYLKTSIAKSTFALDPFGALSSITLERTARLNPDKVTSASELADKLTQKKDKEQETIDKLTKQKTILELQKALEALQQNP